MHKLLFIGHDSRRTRYLVVRQYCLVETYESTGTSHSCGLRLPSVHINFNATSYKHLLVLPSTEFVQQQ